MKILITGGAGFLGQQLIKRLLADRTLTLTDASGRSTAHPLERVVSFDVVPGGIQDPRVENRSGNLGDPATVAGLVDRETAVIIHLAAVVSGTAEADFDLGMTVNLDGTRLLLDACRRAGHQPRLLFSSSIAVFGGDLPAVVSDTTPPTPQGSYGTQKLIGELLVQDYTRKGYVDGRSVRVPTATVRPGRPNGAASGFASGIIREPLAGVDMVLPVPDETAMWVASPRSIVGMFLHALALSPTAFGWHRSLNLPGCVVTMTEAMKTLQAVAGEAALAHVKRQPDPAVQRLVSTWAARFDTARARSLGFVADQNFGQIVRAYVEDNRDAVRLPVQLGG